MRAPLKTSLRQSGDASLWSLKRQDGVALVITLIMLAVITFMAITFLAIARREKGQVGTSTDQTTARFTADAGTDQAKARILASILATTNIYAFDLLSSTNFINWNGFDPSGTVYDQRTNVNYDYQNDPPRTKLTPAQAQQNLANLLLSPRVPVFVTNRFFVNSNEFRFFVDLNRDGVYTPNGYWPEFPRITFPRIRADKVTSTYSRLTRSRIGQPEHLFPT